MSQTGDSNRLLVPLSERDRVRGVANAPVILVEYGDYQCPECGKLHKAIEEIQQRLGDLLGFVFRHFPQTQIHRQAQKAAEAAEAAAAQGKFWQMHDMLFEHQQALGNGSLVQYANDIGLDISQFLEGVSENIYVNRINEDIEGGRRTGVTDTPTLFINGVRYRNANETEQLLAAIIEAGNFHDKSS